ncbi:MAG: hypothetical protein GY923_15295 [Aestuariibacter sp.]|nr:hypothetical protein [Aestuariibacter sp.]
MKTIETLKEAMGSNWTIESIGTSEYCIYNTCESFGFGIACGEDCADETGPWARVMETGDDGQQWDATNDLFERSDIIEAVEDARDCIERNPTNVTSW